MTTPIADRLSSGNVTPHE